MSFDIAAFLTSCLGKHEDIHIANLERDGVDSHLFCMSLIDLTSGTPEGGPILQRYATAHWDEENRVLQVGAWLSREDCGLDDDADLTEFANAVNGSSDCISTIVSVPADMLGATDNEGEEDEDSDMLRIHVSLRIHPRYDDPARQTDLRLIFCDAVRSLDREADSLAANVIEFMKFGDPDEEVVDESPERSRLN